MSWHYIVDFLLSYNGGTYQQHRILQKQVSWWWTVFLLFFVIVGYCCQVPTLCLVVVVPVRINVSSL
jgi:ABC-type multidrug transport system permease subunit